MIRKIFLSIMTVLLMPVLSFAEDMGKEMENVFSLFAEEEMVYTSSKYLQPLSQSPSTITVITEEEIRQSGATTIPEILRIVPGMEVMQTGVGGYNVSIRGNNDLSSNKLLVLIDGRSIQEEFNKSVIWVDIPIALEEIDQIEVIRGPGSAIWGANAFDGVVNIITKRPHELKGTLVSETGGGAGTYIGSLIHAGEKGRMGYKLSLGYHRANQWRDKNKKGLEVFRSNGRVDYELSPKSNLSFSGGISHAPNTDLILFDIGRGEVDIQRAYFLVSYSDPKNKIHAYWNWIEIESIHEVFLNIAAIGDAKLKYGLYNLEWQRKIWEDPVYRLTGGIQYRLLDVFGNILTGQHINHYIGVFFQGEWHPIDNLSLIIGGRYDYHTTIHHTFSPRASLIYRYTASQTLRFSVGQAYRGTTPFESYSGQSVIFQTPAPGGPVTQTITGNTDLDPERITSYELGYSVHLFKRLKGEFNLFYNQLRDLVDLETIEILPNSNILSAYFNRGEADIYGGEIGGDLQMASWLTTFANYAFQEIDDRNPEAIKRSAPKHKINAGLRVQLENGLSTNFLIRYVSKIKYPSTFVFPLLGISPVNPSYTIVNLRVGYRFLENKNGELAISVYNLLNDAHRQHPLADELGTRVLAHLSVKFD